MKTGTDLAKPWFALFSGIAGGAMHIIYYSINRLSYHYNKNTVNQPSYKINIES